MPRKQGGQPGFMAMACLPELYLLTYSHTVTHCWHVTGRMLHFELMPVTSNSEEIELWKSFDHWERFCLTLYSLIFCLFCWFALFIPFSLLLVKSNRVLSAQGAVRVNYFLIKCIFFFIFNTSSFLFIRILWQSQSYWMLQHLFFLKEKD